MSESNPFLSETYESDRNIIKHSIEQYSELISRVQGEDKEVVISFMLTHPEYDVDTKEVTAKTEIVSNIIMRRDMAETLVQALSSTIEHENK